MKKSAEPPYARDKKQKNTKNGNQLIQTVNFMTNVIPMKIEKTLFNETPRPKATSMIQQRKNYLPGQSMIQVRYDYDKRSNQEKKSFFREVADFFRKDSQFNHTNSINDKKNTKNLQAISKLSQNYWRVPQNVDDDSKENLKKVEEKAESEFEYLSRMVPGLNSFEFFELPMHNVSPQIVEVVHVKAGVGGGGSSSTTSSVDSSQATKQNVPSTSTTVVTEVVKQPQSQSQASQIVKQIQLQIQKTTVPVVKNGANSSESNNSAIILNNLKVTPAKRSVIQQRIPAPITVVANSNAVTTTSAIASTSSAMATTSSGHLLRILNSPTGKYF